MNRIIVVLVVVVIVFVVVVVFVFVVLVERSKIADTPDLEKQFRIDAFISTLFICVIACRVCKKRKNGKEKGGQGGGEWVWERERDVASSN